MTTIKHGSVNQEPLYGCTGCYELQTFPASDLRVHDHECWCYWCWDEYKEAELGIEYADLPEFGPYMPAPDVSALVEALSALRGCVMETRGPDAHSALVLADAALAAYRKQGVVYEQ